MNNIILVNINHPVHTVHLVVVYTQEQVRDARLQGYITLAELRAIPDRIVEVENRLSDCRNLAQTMQRLIETQRARIHELENNSGEEIRKPRATT